jgi:hypothetical protein
VKIIHSLPRMKAATASRTVSFAANAVPIASLSSWMNALSASFP